MPSKRRLKIWILSRLFSVLFKINDYISFSKLSRLFKAIITGMPTAMTTNSPTATVNHVKRNGNPNTRFNSKAMINIVTVKTIVLNSIRLKMPEMNLVEKIVIDKAIMECPTPKTRSIGPSSDMSRFAIKTPSTIPKRYFLLKTIRWLNISDTRNCTFVNPNGNTIKVTATYKAAIIPLVANVFTFIIQFLLVFFRGMVSNHVAKSLPNSIS